MRFCDMKPKIIKMLTHQKDGDSLSVIENLIDFKRLFFINVVEAKNRGNHAHIKCTQYLFSIRGYIEVEVTNSIDTFKYELECGSNILKIPPLWWAKQNYSSDSTLGVLCDMNYDEDDYIRDWDKFVETIKNEKS